MRAAEADSSVPPVPWKHYKARYSPIQSDELLAKLQAAREKHTMNLVNHLEEVILG